MDFELTEEQRWLADSVGELLRREAGDDARPPTVDEGLWSALVEFGALDVGPGEDGLGAVEVALVARAIGERLAAVPLVATAAVRYVAGPRRSERPTTQSRSASASRAAGSSLARRRRC